MFTKRKFPSTRLRRLRSKPFIRDLVRENILTGDDLIQPLFIKEDLSGLEPIDQMPGISRFGLDSIEKEIEERLSIAGIEVLEARIGYLAYAQEIANAMLKRQQATAIVAARHKIVEGAVSMVEMALEELSKKQIVNLDEDRKAAMVSNLMVILCGDKEASPVLNTGTLNH